MTVKSAVLMKCDENVTSKRENTQNSYAVMNITFGRLEKIKID